MKKLLAVPAIVLMLSGCTATGAEYTKEMIASPARNESVLVLYRPFTLGGGTHPAFKVNEDVKCPALKPDGFTSLSVPEGKTTLEAKYFMEHSLYEFEAKRGKTHYIKVLPNIGRLSSQAGAGLVGLFMYDATTQEKQNTGTFVFTMVEDQYAQKELEGLKHIGDCINGFTK